MHPAQDSAVERLYNEYLVAYVKAGAGEPVLRDRKTGTSELTALAWGTHDARNGREPCSLERFARIVANAETTYQAEVR